MTKTLDELADDLFGAMSQSGLHESAMFLKGVFDVFEEHVPQNKHPSYLAGREAASVQFNPRFAFLSVPNDPPTVYRMLVRVGPREFLAMPNEPVSSYAEAIRLCDEAERNLDR